MIKKDEKAFAVWSTGRLTETQTVCVWSLDFHSNTSNYRPLSERHMKTHSLRDSLLLHSHDIPGGLTGVSVHVCVSWMSTSDQLETELTLVFRWHWQHGPLLTGPFGLFPRNQYQINVFFNPSQDTRISPAVSGLYGRKDDVLVPV